MITFKVDGMSCQQCKAIITNAILSVDSEAGVQVDLEQGIVNVRTLAPAKNICHAIEEKGYEVLGKDHSFLM